MEGRMVEGRRSHINLLDLCVVNLFPHLLAASSVPEGEEQGPGQVPDRGWEPGRHQGDLGVRGPAQRQQLPALALLPGALQVQGEFQSDLLLMLPLMVCY